MGSRTRTHLHVVAAPSTDTPSDPDQGIVRVALVHFAPQPLFQPGQFVQVGEAGSPRSRRVVQMQFTAHLAFTLRPLADNATTNQASRARLLDDMALIAHLLAAPDVYNGKAFASSAPDPGYRVLGFHFERGSSAPAAVDGLLTGNLSYQGLAEIWPPAVSREEGEIRTLNTTLVALPLEIAVDRPTLLATGTTTVHIRGAGGRRLTDGNGASESLRLALTVLSDLSPDQRGTIISGEAGPETGSRIVLTNATETIVTFQASALAPDEPRTEYIAVHFAMPDLRRGLFLGSVAVQTMPGAAP